jgi:hypothetical protein
MKIEYGGKPYNCTKWGDVVDMTNTSEMLKNYKCAVMRGKDANAEWRCDQERRGTGVKTEVVEQENNGSKSSGKKRAQQTRIY